jgi:hypothetical protein
MLSTSQLQDHHYSIYLNALHEATSKINTYFDKYKNSSTLDYIDKISSKYVRIDVFHDRIQYPNISNLNNNVIMRPINTLGQDTKDYFISNDLDSNLIIELNTLSTKVNSKILLVLNSKDFKEAYASYNKEACTQISKHRCSTITISNNISKHNHLGKTTREDFNVRLQNKTFLLKQIIVDLEVLELLSKKKLETLDKFLLNLYEVKNLEKIIFELDQKYNNVRDLLKTNIELSNSNINHEKLTFLQEYESMLLTYPNLEAILKYSAEHFLLKIKLRLKMLNDTFILLTK